MKRILSLLLTLLLLLSTISIPVMATEINKETSPIETNNVEEILTESQMKRQDIVEDQNIIIKEKLEEKTEEIVEVYEDIEARIEEQPTTSKISIKSFGHIANRYLLSALAIGTITPINTGYYQVAIANANGSFTNKGDAYTDFVQAKSAMNIDTNANAVVLDTRRIIGNQVVAMKDGVVVITANKVGKSVMTFNFASEDQISTYVENNIDGLYYDSTGSTVKMGISGQIVEGIKIGEVELVPINQAKQSYYTKNSNGDLIHSVARYTINQTTNRYIGNYESITISKAPSFMTAGVKYYSVDGEQFYKDSKLKNLAGKFYPYFKFLSFRSKTMYTAEELDHYIASWNKSNSTLNGKGAAFIKAQNDFGVNAALLLAFAIHESGYGTSTIAREKNNLFGVNATDANPYGNASVFNSIEACIYNQAEYQISRGYADANTDGRYFGVNLGNKTVGLNVKYASDPYWGEKIAGHMYRIDKLLGNKDDNKYQLAVTNKITYAKKQASSSSPNYYKYSVKNFSIPKGIPVIVTNNSNGWYKVQSDMGIDSNGTTPASYKTQYNYTLSKTYVSTADFTLINDPTIKYLDPAEQESNETEEPIPEAEPLPEPITQDTTAPSISAKSGSTFLTNEAFTNLDTTITITDESTYTKTVTKNSTTIPWPSDSIFTSDGVYTITSIDDKGNKSTFIFTIDKTMPNIKGTSTIGTIYINDSYVKTDVKVTYADANYESHSVTKDGKSFAWPSDSIFKTDGKYVVTVKDKAQNISTYTFTIDKIKPKIIVKSATGINYTNRKCVNTDTKVTYIEQNYLSKTITKDGKSITWPSNNTFTIDGEYIATVKDKANNTTIFTFTIDKTKPTVVVKTTGGFSIKPGQTSIHNVKATYSDKNYLSKTVTRNGKSFSWPTKDTFKSLGTYVITVKDKADNVTTYKFYLR